jgi:hypothetical protein
MNQQIAVASNNGMKWALTGILFAACYFAADFLRNALTSAPLPLPGAAVEEAARYFDGSRTAVLVVGVCQILSAIALFVFAGCVVNMVRDAQGEGGTLFSLTRVGGTLSAALLLICGILGMVLVPVAASGNLDLLGIVRTVNFLTGGTLHVASLGIFIGAASLAARRTKALPSWICWLGIVVAVIGILSLASVFVYFANAFILLGRLLSFVWAISAGISLARGKRQPRAVAVGEEHHALA